MNATMLITITLSFLFGYGLRWLQDQPEKRKHNPDAPIVYRKHKHL